MPSGKRLRGELTRLGYKAAPSLANFLFFDAREDAGELAKRLLTQGVIVKPWKEKGYTSHVRVSVGSRESDDQFVAALARRRPTPMFRGETRPVRAPREAQRYPAGTG